MATYKKKYKEKIKDEKEQDVIDVNVEENSTTAEVFNALDETASKTEAFIEKNKKFILIIIGLAASVVLGYLGYNEFIAKPKQAEAMNKMYQAQKHFNDALSATDKAKDSLLNLALKGSKGKLGMLDIISDYSGTPSANLANYYAGTAYLRLKKYKKAIEHLNNFESEDEILAPLAKGNIGDAFIQLNQSKEALEYYEQAIEMRNNEYITPMYLYKAGALALEMRQYDKTLEYFNRIKQEYPNSAEATNIDVFIGEVTALSGK